MSALQMWGHFLPGKRYSPALSNHQIGNLSGGHELPQPKAAKPDLWDPATSFWARPATLIQCLIVTGWQGTRLTY